MLSMLDPSLDPREPVLATLLAILAPILVNTTKSPIPALQIPSLLFENRPSLAIEILMVISDSDSNSDARTPRTLARFSSSHTGA